MTVSEVPPDAELVRRASRASGLLVNVTASLDDLYFQGLLAVEDNFEPAVSVAKLTLPRDGVAVDLGACLGVVSAALSQIAPQGRVVSIEASPAMQMGLLETCAAVSPSNITVVNAAVGASEGTAGYHAHPQGGAWGYVDANGGDLVRQTTVDALVIEHGLKRLDFVKVDTEGSELTVLHGAEQSIRKFSPVLVAELNPFCLWRYGRTLPQDLIEWIRDRYEFMWSIDANAVVTPLQSHHEVDRLLNSLGARGGMVDVVASANPIEFPTPLWTRWADENAAADSKVATSAAPSKSWTRRIVDRARRRKA